MNPNLPNSSSPSTTSPGQGVNSPNAQTSGSQGTSMKEHGGFSSPMNNVEAVSLPEEHIPKEVVASGVVHKELIDVPPDVAQLGVQVSGGGQKPGQIGTVNVFITLPISDDQVISGLHNNVKSSISWLAIWCLRQLKRAHTTLRVVHGKVMRVKA